MNRCLSNQERFHAESFTHAVYLFDVWDTTQLFGRKLSSDERIAILKILMPPDFVQREIFGLPLESYKDTTLQEERQQQIRDIFGDDIFRAPPETRQSASCDVTTSFQTIVTLLLTM
ncbi:MAG: hypothetical protein GWQ05_18505, partial [Verrucomicrobiaceae bacterium]|nr:hypothetical protein [Verrucomicrobiaceae bacterium]